MYKLASRSIGLLNSRIVHYHAQSNCPLKYPNSRKNLYIDYHGGRGRVIQKGNLQTFSAISINRSINIIILIDHGIFISNLLIFLALGLI